MPNHSPQTTRWTNYLAVAIILAITAVVVAVVLYGTYGGKSSISVTSPTPTATPAPSSTPVATPTATPTPKPSISTLPNPALCTFDGRTVSCCAYLGDPASSCITCLQNVGKANEDDCYVPLPTPVASATPTITPTATPMPAITLESLRDASANSLRALYGRTITPDSTYGYGGDVASYYLSWRDSYPYYSVFIENFPAYREKSYVEPGKYGYNRLFLTYNYSNGTQTVKEVDYTDQVPTNCHENDTNRPTCYQKIRMSCANFSYMLRIEATEYSQTMPLMYEAQRIATSLIPRCPN